MDVYVCECPPLNLASFIINKCSIINVVDKLREKKRIFFFFLMKYLPCELSCACLDSRVRLVNSSDLSCQYICICTGLSLTSIHKNICVKDFVTLAAWLELVAFFYKQKHGPPIGMVCFERSWM